MSDRLGRLAPLTGVVFAVLAVAAFGSAPGAPSASASGGRVIAFYEAHGSSARTSDYLWMVALAFGFDLARATVPSHLAPAAAQALNVLALKLLLPVSAGGLVFGIASGLAILRGAQLPKWLGWAAIVIGIATATPAGLLGLVAFIFWSATVSILIWKRGRAPSAAQPPFEPITSV